MGWMRTLRAMLAISLLGMLGLLAGCSPAADPQLPAPSIPLGGSGAELTKDDVDAWLDGQIPPALGEAGIPGATVSVVSDGEVLTSRGYGYADTGIGDDQERLVDSDETLFRVGSVSKLATAVAVIQLVEEDVLDLDTDVSEYVDVALERHFEDDVTVRHLLTHTAGFEERLGSLFVPEGEADLEAALEDAPAQVYPPGTTPAYSNYGFALAGYIVEQVSGEPFEQYIKSHVFDPADMESSSFSQPLPPSLVDRVATGYTTIDGLGQPFETVGVFPAGSMSASGSDMGRFMLALMGESAGDGELLDAQTRGLMQSPALDASSLGALAAGQRMTLGFFDESRNGHRILGHGGDTDVFHSALEVYPDEGAGIFISMNGSGEGASSLTIRSELMRGFSDRYFPGEAAETNAGGSDATTSSDVSDGPAAEVAQDSMMSAEERADLVAGRYESTRSMHTTFLTALALAAPTRITALEDDRLLVSPDPGTGEDTVFTEISPWVWQEDDGYRRIAAQVEDGEVVRIGHDSAMSIEPISPFRAAVLPVLFGSLTLITLLLVLWPIGSLMRWRAGRLTGASVENKPAPLGRAGKLARLGGLAGLIAAAGWVGLFVALSGSVVVPTVAVRAIQVFQVLAVLGVVPAIVDIVHTIRCRRGVGRTIGAVILLLSLVGLSAAALALHLFSLDVSF